MAGPAETPLGGFGWMELATSNHEAAFDFYSKLFGWQALSRMDMGPPGVYLIFGSDDVQRGGMYKLHQERSPRPYWLAYAAVANVDAAAAAATAAGGRIIVGPMEVPGGGRIAQVIDPSGAMFAVHSATAAKAAAPQARDQAAGCETGSAQARDRAGGCETAGGQARGGRTSPAQARASPGQARANPIASAGRQAGRRQASAQKGCAQEGCGQEGCAQKGGCQEAGCKKGSGKEETRGQEGFGQEGVRQEGRSQDERSQIGEEVSEEIGPESPPWQAQAGQSAPRGG